MEGFAMVLMHELRAPDIHFKEPANRIIRSKWMSFIRKYGQHQAIVVATVNGVITIVDGSFIYDILKELGKESAICYNIGELTRREYLICRLITAGRTNIRLNYIDIAKAISEICKTERDVLDVANATDIPYDDVMRYRDLLTFDWDNYLKEPVNPDQLNLFDYE